MDATSLFAELARLVDGAAREELPAVAGRLEEARVRLHLRLAPSAPQAPPAVATTTWITPAEAAAIASVPTGRVYEWAQGRKWATRPSRRCLRVDEAKFRAWLATR